LFSDISNLKIVSPNTNNNYINNNFNGNYDPYNNIIVDNYEYLKYNNILHQEFPDNNFLFYDNIFFIKIWIGNIKTDTLSIECNLLNCNIYYNSIINNINNKYNTNLNLIKNLNLLPSIPYTNIDKFLLFKKDKKIIFYYNYYANSGQFSNINHDENIIKLANKYNDYYICCAIKPDNVSNFNIISLEDFDYIKEPSCENVAKAYYCAINSEIVCSFDTGACFYYLNDKFNENFKGIWYHYISDIHYYNNLNKDLNNNVKIIYSIDEILI
jgi:hypothetical protein